MQAAHSDPASLVCMLKSFISGVPWRSVSLCVFVDDSGEIAHETHKSHDVLVSGSFSL